MGGVRFIECVVQPPEEPGPAAVPGTPYTLVMGPSVSYLWRPWWWGLLHPVRAWRGRVAAPLSQPVRLLRREKVNDAGPFEYWSPEILEEDADGCE